nr:hypothetical protein [Alistipes montrealensis]
MQIGTERLEIRILTPEHLALWLDDLPRLEQEFTCRYRAEPLAGDFRTTVEIGYGLGRDFEHNGTWPRPSKPSAPGPCSRKASGTSRQKRMPTDSPRSGSC